MARIAGCCRLVYNLALEQRRMAWDRGVSLGYVAQAAELPALKAAFPFLKECPSQSLQSALRHLDTAFQRFFQGCGRYPTFKKKRNSLSFTLPDPAQMCLDWHRNRIILPKFGKTRRDNGPLALRAHRALKGKVRSVTVSRDGGAWFVSILVRRRVKEPVSRSLRVPDQIVGVDRGVAAAVVTDAGHILDVQGQTCGSQKRQRRMQQALARKKKGSNNRRKAVKRLAALKAREARRRKDAIHKITCALVKNHDGIVIEDLKVRQMSRSSKGSLDEPGRNVRAKSGLNRAILDKGWGEMRRQLHYKAEWAGKRVLEVNARNTSRSCPACDHVSAENRKTQAAFACVSCSYRGHADQVAAFNIKQRGLAALGLPPAARPNSTPEDVRCQPVERSGISLSEKQENGAVRPVLPEMTA